MDIFIIDDNTCFCLAFTKSRDLCFKTRISTSSELLYALNPEFGIISTSINNRYGMPHQEVINQLNVFHIKYFITSLDGSIQMTIYQGEIKWETYPP